MRILLIDADVTAYRFVSTAQKTYKWDEETTSVVCDDIEDVTPRVDAWLAEIKEELSADALVICLSCATADGWRIKLLPTYKAGRGEKPMLLGAVKDHMRKHYRTFERDTLEADDVMGILSTSDKIIKGEKIIVSIDKDMRTIPGLLFNPSTDRKPQRITVEEADRWHLMQTLVGDTVDNYKGCPGVGPVKAAKILHPIPLWSSVADAFAAAGLTYSDALLQARIARICRASDYDFKRKEVKLWQP